MKTTITTLLLAGSGLIAISPPAQAQTSNTSWQGGSGGALTRSLDCNSDERLAGVRVRYGVVIDEMQARCVRTAANGSWQGSPANRGSASTNNPVPANSWTNIDCPNNRYVTGFRTYLRSHTGSPGPVLARLQLRCQLANAQLVGLDPPSVASGGASASGGAWTPTWTDCPVAHPLGDGLGTRSGWYVDRMRMRCRAPNQAPQPGAFNLLSPTNNYAILFDQTFSWQASSNAGNYSLLVYPDPPSQGSPPWTNNVTQTYPAGGATSLGFTPTMINNLHGRKIAWTVRACSSLDTCRMASEFRYSYLPLLNANQSSPATNASVPNRRPNFSWQQREWAQHYKVVLQPNSGSPASQRVTITPPQGVSGTSFAPSQDLPASLGNSPVWFVQACRNFPGGPNDVCGGPRTAGDYRTVNLGSGFSFSQQLAPTFKHARCTTCHAVAATGFRRVNDRNPGVLPANHAVVNAQTQCSSCHTSALLPSAGSINPGFQAAPSHMDFRNKSNQQLCSMAKQNVGGHTPQQHMTQDKLILWAVGDGRVPGKTLPTAPPNTIPSWQSLVNQWVDAGMPCD